MLPEFTLESWSYVGSFFAGALSAWVALDTRRRQKKKNRAETYQALVGRHYSIWKDVLAQPGGNRIIDPNADPNSLTQDDVHRVNTIVLNVIKNAYESARVGDYKLPRTITADLREFFGLPIPSLAWSLLKKFHDPNFVEFVSAALAVEKDDPSTD